MSHLPEGLASAWGTQETQFFFSLTPERVLTAVEALGFQCTGRCTALGSMENRVYDVEVETESKSPERLKGRFRVVKFYRPGRWSEAQIREEHQFLLELQQNEIPVVAPEVSATGETLYQEKGTGIFYTVFPRVGGRSPDEFSDEQLQRLGRLLARIHAVGAIHQAPHRVTLSPDSYGLQHLKWLVDSNVIPPDYRTAYIQIVESICSLIAPWFRTVANQRIHGDCHLGNLLWNDQGPFFLDFDDMVNGPPIQDLWLLVGGRDAESARQMDVLLEAYGQLRSFDRATLRLIEPLRALRFIHFSAWIARRWEDPAFPRNFPQFGTEPYWIGQIQDLKECLALMSHQAGSYPH